MGMVVFKKELFEKFTISVLIFFISILLTCCGSDTLYVQDSPDGIFSAEAYTKRIGKQNVNISVIKKNSHPPYKGNVAIFQGLVPVDLVWVDSHHLKLIIYDADENSIIFFNPKIENISVSIKVVSSQFFSIKNG